MKLFCRENHSEEIIVTKDRGQELLEAKAKLARLKKLPISAFAEKSYKSIRWSPYGYPVTYSVDNKADAVARAEADIAELEVLINEENL